MGRWTPPAERDGEVQTRDELVEALPRSLAAKYLAAVRDLEEQKAANLLRFTELRTRLVQEYESKVALVKQEKDTAEYLVSSLQRSQRSHYAEVNDLMEALGAAKLLIDLMDHDNWMRVQWHEEHGWSKAIPKEWIIESRKNIEQATDDWRRYDEDIYGGEVSEFVPKQFPDYVDYVEQRKENGVILP